MAVEEEEVPDFGKVPNFDSFGVWLSKLNKWCEKAVDHIDHLMDKLAESNAQVQDLMNEVESLQDNTQLEDLLEYIKDVQRGVRSGPDLFDFIERNGY